MYSPKNTNVKRNTVRKLSWISIKLRERLNGYQLALITEELCGGCQCSLPDISIYTNTCRLLIDSLSKFQEKAFEPLEWVALVLCLANNQPLPETLIKKLSAAKNVIDIRRPKEINLVREAIDPEKANALLFRFNRTALISSGLFYRVLYSLWPKEEMIQNVQNMEIKRPSGNIIMMNAELVSDLLSCEWNDAGVVCARDTAIQLIATSLNCVNSIIVNGGIEDSTRTNLVEKYCSIHEKVVSQFAAAFYFDTQMMDISNIVESYANLLQKTIVTPLSILLRVICMLEAVSPWLDFNGVKKRILPVALWKSIEELLNRLNVNQSLLSEEQPAEVQKTSGVPIASPEDDDETVAGNWLECILEQVPAMMDKQSAAESQLSTERARITNMVLFLLKMVVLVDSTHECDDLIASIFSQAELCDWDESIMEQLEITYKQLSETNSIGPVLQKRLASQALRTRGPHYLDVLRIIIEGGSNVIRSVLASLLFNDIVERLEISVKNGSNQALSSTEVMMLENIVNSLGHNEAALITKRTAKLFSDVLSDESLTPPSFVESVTNVFFILSRGGSATLNNEDAEPWHLNLLMIGYSESEWAVVMTNLANYFVRYPSHPFLFATYHFLTKVQLLERDNLAIMLFLLRLTQQIRTSEARQRIVNFNSHCPDMEEALKQFLLPENISRLTNKTIIMFTHMLREGTWKPYIQSVMLSILILHSNDLTLDFELFVNLTNLCHVIDLHELQEVCGLWGALPGLERLHCLISIWRNPLLRDANANFEDCYKEALSSDVIKLFSSEHPALSECSDPLGKHTEDESCKNDVDDILLKQFRHKIALSLLSEIERINLDSLNCDLHDAMIKWAVKISSSVQYTRDVAAKADDQLKKIGSDKATALRYVHLLNLLLTGATNIQPVQLFERRPLNIVLCSLFQAIVCSERLALVWVEEYSIILGEYFDQCASDDPSYEWTSLTPCFVAALTYILEHNKSCPELCSQLRSVIASRLHLLPTWLRRSQSPIAIITCIAPILDDLKQHNVLNMSILQIAMRESVAVLLCTSLIDDLHGYYAIDIQSTDRQAQTSLNWIGSKQPSDRRDRPHSFIPLNEQQDIFREALQIICLYANSETHYDILYVSSKNLPNWIELSEEEEKVMKGESLLQKDNRLVFRLMVVSNLLDYCTQIARIAGSKEDNGYFSDSEALKMTVTRRGGPTALPMVIRRTDEPRPLQSTPLCTYSSTEKEFVQQHWYNCHTCKMTDNKGVCSICAVNCHRGHDLSYSKLGLFFCDCGAGGCASLKSTTHEGSSISAARGRLAPTENIAIDSPPVHLTAFDIQRDLHIDSEDIMECLNRLRHGLEEKVEIISRIVDASVVAHDSRWTLTKRRDDVRQSLADPDKLVLVYDQAIMEDFKMPTNKSISVVDSRRPPEPPNDRNKARDISQVMPLENGKNLWLMLGEHATTLQIYHIHPGQSFIDELEHIRVDTEPIGFAGRRLACRDEKIAIAGLSDVLALRMSKEGDIIDRTVIKLSEMANTHSNPVVKAIWSPYRPALLAVGTVQLVRVYDLTLDADNCLEELVLPVGNVEDIEFMRNEESDEIRVLVLSTAGHLYEHKLTSLTAENTSYFLTNTIDLPHAPQSTGSGVSLHFSQVSYLLFLSLEKGTWFVPVEKGNLNRGVLWNWKRLDLSSPVHCWQESSGVMACLSHPIATPVVYIYPTLGQILVQKVHVKRSAYAHVLFSSSSGDMLYSMPMFYESPTNVLFAASWSNLPDLWMENMPNELCLQQDKDKEEPTEDLTGDDLVTMLERCEPIERVEVSSQQLSVFYDTHELIVRMSTVGSMPITAIQMEQFTITMRVSDPNMIVRAVRVELPAERGRGPSEVIIANMTYSLGMSSDLTRFFDIRLTRSQSLELDHRNIPITFSGRSRSQVGMTVVSVRLYGISKRDFGFPRSQLIARPPISLPDQFLLQTVRMLAQLMARGMVVKSREWMLNLACRLISPRSCHRDMISAASRLLRVIMKKDMRGYYARKDAILIGDLALFCRSNIRIPSDLIGDLMLQFKYMMCTRWTQFWCIVKKSFGDSLGIMTFLRNEVTECKGDTLPLLEVYTVLLFILISLEDPNSITISKQYLSLFTDPKTCHMAHRVRLVAQTLVYSFSLSTRNDRTLAKSLPHAMVMKWGGLRPFFNRTKIMGSDENEEDVEFMMGPLVTTDYLNGHDMFELESAWILHLLQDVMVKIRDEGSIGSLPVEGVPVGQGDSVPSTSLLIFAIVLMAQLYPAKLLPTVVQLIAMVDWNGNIIEINDYNYRQFLLFRLISVLLSKCGEHVESRRRSAEKDIDNKKGTASITEEDPTAVTPTGTVDGTESGDSRDTTPISEDRAATKRRSTEKLLTQIVSHLCNAGVLNFCRNLLENMAPYWRTTRENRIAPRAWSRDSTPTASDITTTGISTGKSNVMDARDHYYAMITDVALRLPSQMRRISKEVVFDEKWHKILCELVSYHHAPQVRRQSKKVIVAMYDGDKQQYRSIRDKYMMYSHIDLLKKKYFSYSSFTHQQLTEMVEIVSAVAVTANERTNLWRGICEEQLNWLLQLSCKVADAVSCSVIELLVLAIRENAGPDTEDVHLADKLISDEDNRSLLKMLLVRYLIGRDENRRWLMHGMLRSTVQLAMRQNQIILVRILWTELWPLSRGLGSHGAQLADLLATYAPRLLSSADLQLVCDAELQTIKDISAKIEKEGHAGSYRQMTGLGLGWKTMLMETSPCLCCFNRKDMTETLKLNSIKQDARFAANAMMIKLACHYEISRVIIKLTDVKRNKMIKKVNLFYCPKTVESAVELKTCPELWQRAATINVTGNDTEIILSLAIPVVTASLVIQFSELTESRQNTELHCPRCSSIVQPNPGVCENCGENVFQCVKCRAINYDEKDPFLCQSCGFCKYARMDIVAVCRPLPGVQPITTDAERVSCIEAMSRLLSEMEQTRAQLQSGRALCESLWLRTRPLPPVELHMESPESADSLVSAVPAINALQPPVHALLLATTHCKATHEELCMQTQQLIAFREELSNYDRSSRTGPLLHQAINQGFYSTSSRCFGCLCSSVLHSLAILQSICDDATCMERLLEDNVIYNHVVDLGKKYDPLREEVEMLLCRLSFDNKKGTEKLCELVLSGKISGTVLARCLNTFPDSLWQNKLRSLLACAMTAQDEDTTLATLMIIDRYLEDGKPIRRRVYKKLSNKRTKRTRNRPEVVAERRRVQIINRELPDPSLFANWMNCHNDFSDLVRDEGGKFTRLEEARRLTKTHDSWLWCCLFSPWVSVRAAASKIIVAVAQQPGHLGAAMSVILRGLPMASLMPPAMTDHFFRAAHFIIGSGAQIKIRLYAEGVHVWLIKIIYKECKRMHEEEQHESSMDHSFGTLLRSYVELLCLILSGSPIETILLKGARDHILILLLQSTIFLKRVLLRRTRAVDASRCSLERLLRRVSAKDPLMLMKAAVHSLDAVQDLNTQAHIVSVILDVLDPKQKEEEEFHIHIEKDPAQEDFLQGRMTGNPYKSTDPGMGPLMRDIKNKICRDTEMVALLEDDNGMELLVNNVIVSLALPVRAVFDKLWRRAHPGQAMTIVYRMRGLLGDAIETFVSNLGEANEGESEEDESLDSLTSALSQCGGLDRALGLLTSDTSTAGRFLLVQLRKLFDRYVKSEQGRRDLVTAGAMKAFMKVLNTCISPRCNDEGILLIGLDYLQMMASIVSDISVHPLLHDITEKDAEWLLSFAMRRPESTTSGEQRSEVKRVLWKLCGCVAKVLGNLVIGNENAEEVLVEQYRRGLQWNEIDETNDVSLRVERVLAVERLCEITAGILNSEEGCRLKQKILDSGAVDKACLHLVSNHPPLYSATESQEWKTFLLRPSLKLMLSLMHGIARGHKASQKALAKNTLHILHRLEQVASDNSIGTLAENVVEALKENKEVKAQIEAVRLETKQKKRQMAMAMRNKQLSKMGMQVGKQGEVKVSSRKIANEPVLDEVADPLAACCICREPLFQGPRVAAAYAFASSVSADGHSPILSTVSQMVMVHIDCHQNAIRRSGGGRNVDEWTKASLHNAGAKCNVLTPISCGAFNEADWTAALNRFQADLEVVITVPLSRSTVFLDICELIDRFINFRSFSDVSQGGGRESNAQYLAVLHLLAISLPAEDTLPIRNGRQRITGFLLTELSLQCWMEQRIDVLHASLNDATSDGSIGTWDSLRSLCLTWAFVDRYFRDVIPILSDDRLEWLRTNLLVTLEKTSHFVRRFDLEIAVVEGIESFTEIMEIPFDQFASFFSASNDDDI